ncbi:General transcription factor 2-related zinc finger protein, partial [Zea mays]
MGPTSDTISLDHGYKTARSRSRKPPGHIVMSARKYPSGSEKRKRKKRTDEFIETQRRAMDKFFSSNSTTSKNQNEMAIVSIEEQPGNNPEDQGFTPEENIDTDRNDNNVSDHEPMVNSPPTENASVDEQPVFTEDIYDPRNWDNLDNKSRDILVEKGPIRDENIEFPLDTNGRHFSYTHYSRKMSNGEVYYRKWLVYSKRVDRVFCFSCKLFNTENCKSSLGHEGFRDWRHINERLKEHEGSIQHIISMNSWNELRVRLVNKVSKQLQSSSMCIDATLMRIEDTVNYFQNYRNNGFASSLIIAKEIASELGVEPSFPVKRHAKRKKQYDETDCEEADLEAEKAFEVNYFLVMVDIAISSLKSRFEELQSFKDIFGFLMDSITLKVKYHLASIGGFNVTKCKKVLAPVKQEMEALLTKKTGENEQRKKEKQRERDEIDLDKSDGSNEEDNEHENDVIVLKSTRVSNNSSSSRPSTNGGSGTIDNFYKPQSVEESAHKNKIQTKLSTQKREDRRDRACEYICQFLYEAGIAHNTVTLPSFGHMLEAIGAFGRGLRGPSAYEMSGPFLKRAKQKVLDRFKNHQESWQLT